MPKQTRKLLVYLDQNFLSAMAKADGDEEIDPAFTEIYRLLHQGFVDEKLVVPSSVLHDIESSLATHLKDRIATYQGYLGQVRLRRPEEIWNRQTEVGLARFSGRATRDPLDPKLAFLDDPDQRVQRHGIRVDAHLESFNFRAARHRTAKGLEALRLRLLQEGIGYDQQLKVERQEQRDHFLRTYFRFCHPVSAEQRQRFTEYADTSEFLALPRLSIEARLYAAILTRKPTRAIKPSDATDIEILSAYAPYMDVVCTDAFMADQLRSLGIDREFGIGVFHARANSLRELKALLEESRHRHAPGPRGPPSRFLSCRRGTEGSSRLASSGGSPMRRVRWEQPNIAKSSAFDDGAMPRYEYRQFPGKHLPFYGLADVTPLELPEAASEDDILKSGKNAARSISC